MMGKTIKANHNGAKNGGGYWGTREEAKTLSKKARREAGKREIKKSLKEEGKDGRGIQKSTPRIRAGRSN